MIITQNSTEIVKSEELTELSYNVSEENKGILFHILRSQLYSNKLAAIVREYSTNASDVHIETDQTKPFEVHLPTKFSPTLRIRDFGVGMTLDDIKNNFISMASSSKRDSNLLNGCLGLGCKAGFCYTNSFNVTSITDDEVIEGTSYIDETKEGKFAILERRPRNADEETGVEIKIPVHEKDWYDLEYNAKNVLSAFSTPFKLLQAGKELSVDNNAVAPGQLIVSHNYRYSGHSVVMGNVRYPITKEELQSCGINLNGMNVCLSFGAPNGSLDFVASREHLEFKEKTKQNLKAIYTNFLRKSHNSIKALFSKCNNEWDAFHIAHRIRYSKNSKYKNIIDVLWKLQSLEFNGKLIREHTIYSEDYIVWTKKHDTDTPLDKKSPGWERKENFNPCKSIPKGTKFWFINVINSDNKGVNFTDKRKDICRPWSKSVLEKVVAAGITTIIVPCSTERSQCKLPIPKEWFHEVQIEQVFSESVQKTRRTCKIEIRENISIPGQIWIRSKDDKEYVKWDGDYYKGYSVKHFKDAIYKIDSISALLYADQLCVESRNALLSTNYARLALEPFLDQSGNMLKALYKFMEAADKIHMNRSCNISYFLSNKPSNTLLHPAIEHSYVQEYPLHLHTKVCKRQLGWMRVGVHSTELSSDEREEILIENGIDIETEHELLTSIYTVEYTTATSSLRNLYRIGYTLSEFADEDRPTADELNKFMENYPYARYTNFDSMPEKLLSKFFHTAKEVEI